MALDVVSTISMGRWEEEEEKGKWESCCLASAESAMLKVRGGDKGRGSGQDTSWRPRSSEYGQGRERLFQEETGLNS